VRSLGRRESSRGKRVEGLQVTYLPHKMQPFKLKLTDQTEEKQPTQLKIDPPSKKRPLMMQFFEKGETHSTRREGRKRPVGIGLV